MEEEKKIIEKRSSFKGWKERNKGKTNQKKNAIVIIITVLILLALVAYPYLSNTDNDKNSTEKKNNTSKPTPIKNTKTNKSDNSPTKKVVSVPNVTVTPKEIIKGIMGVPVVSNSLEITIEHTSPSVLHTDIWVSVKNLDDNEEPFKIGPGTVVIDNMGQQYENIKVAKSAEISQTNLSSNAMREGAIFFERLNDGRSLKKLILNVNNEKIEFTIE